MADNRDAEILAAAKKLLETQQYTQKSANFESNNRGLPQVDNERFGNGNLRVGY